MWQERAQGDPLPCRTPGASCSILLRAFGMGVDFLPLRDLSLAKCIIRLICLTSLWELEEGELILAFGNTTDSAAFDFGFMSLFSGFRVRKSCSFIFHVAVFFSWLLKEAELMRSCC